MSESAATERESASSDAARVSIVGIFATFLFIGAISFGGGVVAYLRDSLVARKRWLDDASFLELMSISNTLPGLNATNMAILVGDRLGGFPGALAGIVGMCLPGFALLTAAGVVYGMHHDHPVATAMLAGIAAAAVGLLSATWFQIGRKTVHGFADAFFILAAVLCIHRFGLSVPVTLVGLGALAIFANRPNQAARDPDERWIRSLR
jgi:chromate transporter